MNSSLLLTIYLIVLFQIEDNVNAKNIYVSLHGSSLASCGTLDSPCRHVKDAAEKITENDVIMIDGSFWGNPAEFDEPHITISKAVQIIGYNGKPILSHRGRGTFITVQNEKKNISEVIIQNVKLKVNERQASILSIHDALITIANIDFHGGNVSMQIECKIHCQVEVESCNFIGMVTGVQVSGSYNKFNVSINNADFSGIQLYSRQGITLIKESHQSDELSGAMTVAKSKFQNFMSAFNVRMNTGGKMTFNVTNCSFSNNGNIPSRTSSAIFISFYNSSLNDTMFFITKSFFTSNRGFYGGAIYVNSSASLFLNISLCSFEGNRAYISGGAIYAYVKSSIYISESRFSRNTCMLPVLGFSLQKGHGGAITLSGHKDATYKVEMKKCHFIENTASAMGGTIYSSLRSIEIKFVSVMFDSCDEFQDRATDGDIVFLLSKVKMQNTTVIMKNPVSERNVVYVHNDDIIIDKNSSFICAKGYKTAITEIGGFLLDGSDFSLFSMLCRTCEYNHYSVSESSFHDLKIWNPQCFSCPPGGICRCGISKPKDYFWGYQVNRSSSITYIQLPIGYGCTGLECRHFNSCAPNREDVMCAKCSKGYSEHVLSQGCISNKHCKRNALWLLAAAFVLIYILLFLYKAEIFSSCIRNLSWLCHLKSKRKVSEAEMMLHEDVYVRVVDGDRDDGGDDDGAEAKDNESNTKIPCTTKRTRPNEFGIGLLKIAFYFYQIEILLHAKIGNKDDMIIIKLLQLSRSFFNFNFLVTYDSNLCAFTNTTAVLKATFRIALISLVFLGLGIIIIIARSLEKVNAKKISVFLRGLGDRALSTSFEIFVLVYGAIVMTGLKLLNCVEYKGEKRLWIQGNIKCFIWWQYVIMSILILWSLPYCILLFILPKMLLKKEVSKSGILFGCIFPLPFLMQRFYRVKFPTPFDGIARTTNDPVIQKILESLILPFKKPANSRRFIWWEGVYIFRRLLLISLLQFVHDDVVKNQLMLFAQIIFLLHHIYCLPFKRRLLNHLETASLTILVMFTSISSSYAYDYKYGISEEEASTLIIIFAWFRVVIVITLPSIAIVVLAVPLILWFIKNVINLPRKFLLYIRSKV